MPLDIKNLKLSGTVNLAAGSTLTTDAGVTVDLSNATLTLPANAVPTMTGDAGAGGQKGLTPAPAAGDAAAGKYLDAHGLWSIPAGIGGGGSSGGSGGDAAAVTPTIVQQVFDRGSGGSTIFLPAVPTAGNLLLFMAFGSGGTSGWLNTAGYTVLYAGSPSNAQAGFIVYRIADGTENTAGFSVNGGDNRNVAVFEISQAFGLICSAGAAGQAGNTAVVPLPAYYRGSLRFVFVEWDNTSNVASISAPGSTLLQAFTGGGNHRGGIASLTGSPLIPLTFNLDSGPDRPGFLAVEVAGVVAAPSSGGVDLTYVSDGDTNGLFYYLGTNGGTVAWANPYPGTLGIAISPNTTVVSGTIGQIVDRQSSNFYTNNDADSYAVFTLPTGKALTLGKWSYRATTDCGSKLKVITISGSMDGSAWTLIDTMNLPNTNDVWTSQAPPAQTSGYRYFKIQESGASWQGTYYFLVGEIELYGSYQ